MPPRLEWEAPIWSLYVRISSQWRDGFSGRTGLDYGPAIRLIEERGWRLERSLDFLRAIEREVLEWEEDERSKRQ